MTSAFRTGGASSSDIYSLTVRQESAHSLNHPPWLIVCPLLRHWTIPEATRTILVLMLSRGYSGCLSSNDSSLRSRPVNSSLGTSAERRHLRSAGECSDEECMICNHGFGTAVVNYIRVFFLRHYFAQNWPSPGSSPSECVSNTVT